MPKAKTNVNENENANAPQTPDAPTNTDGNTDGSTEPPKSEKSAAEYEAEIEALKKQLAAKKDAENAPAEKSAAASPAVDEGNELVTIELFKDNGKYKDDLLVCVNGESCLIKRGVQVKIKKKFFWAIEQSQLQDKNTARLITEQTEEFRRKQKEHLDA